MHRTIGINEWEAAWLALAEEQDWLDGEVAPSKKPPEHSGLSA
jgi:hypothetical protein